MKQVNIPKQRKIEFDLRIALDPQTILRMFQSTPLLQDYWRVLERQEVQIVSSGDYWKLYFPYLNKYSLVSTAFFNAYSIDRTSYSAHHERWDGKGYPLGLHSTQIPYLSRMLTIVDCYDALSSRRRYKNPLPQPEVVKIMLDSSGQYDPILLDKFLELVDTIKTESVKTSLLTLLNVEEKRRQMHE